MNVLCIAEEDHQWKVIAVDHTSKFKVIQSKLDPPFTAFNTENGFSLQKLPDKSQISGKRWWTLLLETVRKENKTLNSFQKLLE